MSLSGKSVLKGNSAFPWTLLLLLVAIPAAVSVAIAVS